MLGGLIRDRLEEGTTGIPVLGDIPILGNLFKATDNSSARTELLVLIKPQVVRNGRSAEQLRSAATAARLPAALLPGEHAVG